MSTIFDHEGAAPQKTLRFEIGGDMDNEPKADMVEVPLPVLEVMAKSLDTTRSVELRKYNSTSGKTKADAQRYYLLADEASMFIADAIRDAFEA